MTKLRHGSSLPHPGLLPAAFVTAFVPPDGSIGSRYLKWLKTIEVRRLVD